MAFRVFAPTLSKMETPSHPEYEINQIRWQGVDIEVRHCRDWLNSGGDMITQHIEVCSAERVPWPITGSGYRSHFLNGQDALAEFSNDAALFVLWWLDQAAQDPRWQSFQEDARQGELF